MVDLTTTLGSASRCRNPVLTASGCAAAGRELHQFFDVAELGAVVTKSIMPRPAVRSADPADGRDAERHAQLDRAAGSGHRLVHRERPGLAGRARRTHRRLDRRRPHRRVRRAGPASSPGTRRCRCSRSTSPARTSRTAGRSSPATRSRPRGSSARCAAPPTRHLPVFAKLSPDVTDITHHRPRLRRRRRRRLLADQHAARHGDRHRHDAPRARRRHRRTVRPGDPAGRGALRLAGAPGAAAPADPRHGRHPHRARRAASSSSPAPRRSRSGTAVFGDPVGADAGAAPNSSGALDERGFASLADAVGYAHTVRAQRTRSRGRSA